MAREIGTLNKDQEAFGNIQLADNRYKNYLIYCASVKCNGKNSSSRRGRLVLKSERRIMTCPYCGDGFLNIEIEK